MKTRIYGPMGQWTEEATRIQLKVSAAMKPVIEDNLNFDIRDLESVVIDAITELFIVQRLSDKYDVPVKNIREVETAGGASRGRLPGLWAEISSHSAGYDIDKARAKALGEIGDRFEVDKVSMGGSSTSITLVGKTEHYNSVNFNFLKDGIYHDIYNDPDYNPYA